MDRKDDGYVANIVDKFVLVITMASEIEIKLHQ